MNTNIFSNLIWKFSERILAQVITFIVSVILARVLLPEQFGIVALVMVFIEVANAIVVSGFNTALIQNKNADEIDFSSAFWLCFFISILVYIIIWFAVIPLSKFYNNEMIIPIFRVLSIRIIISAINTIQHAYVSRHLQFKKYFWSTLFGTIVSAIVGIYLAIKGYGAWALVFQYLTNTTIDTIVLFFTVDWKPKLIFSFERVGKLFSFGWKILLDSIFGTLQINLRNFIIGKIYLSSDLAYYTKSQTFPNLFINNITFSITSVMLPVMSNKNDDKNVINNYVSKATKLSFYVICPMLIGMMLVSKEFICVVLTEKWLPMVKFLQLYCLVCITKIPMSPRNEALKAIGRSDIFFLEHIVYRVIDIIILIIFVKQSPYVLMKTLFLTSFILMTFVMISAHIFNGFHIIKQIKDFTNTIVAVLFLFIMIKIISILQINLLLMLILKIVIGGLTYIMVSKIFSFEEYKMLYEIIMRYVKKIFSKVIKK